MARIDDRTARLTRAELYQRAVDLVPVLKERAARTEEMRQIPPENVRDLLDSGLHRLAVPPRFGGIDAGYDLMLEVADVLGRGCGATSWCYCLWATHAWLAGHWPLAAQEEVFGDGPDALISSSLRSGVGQLDEVKGGFRLSGHWEFSSGCDAASWVMLGVAGPEGWRWVLVPASDYEIVDTWFVAGLRGSGSKDIKVKDALVPAHRVIDRERAGAGDWNGWEIHRHFLYRMPVTPLLGWDLVSPIMGMAQGMIDEFTAMLSGTSGPGKTAESTVIQLRLAEAAVEVDAGRALLRQDIHEILEKAEQGGEFTDLERARYLRDKAFVTKLCLQATNRLFEVSGGHSLFDSVSLQRIHRDVNAGAHRDGLIFDLAGNQYGKVALGLDS
ncbi:MAG: acyl-CoA dehydrogenase family protein [Dehalococcoidia bacterium]